MATVYAPTSILGRSVSVLHVRMIAVWPAIVTILLQPTCQRANVCMAPVDRIAPLAAAMDALVMVSASLPATSSNASVSLGTVVHTVRSKNVQSVSMVRVIPIRRPVYVTQDSLDQLAVSVHASTTVMDEVHATS